MLKVTNNSICICGGKKFLICGRVYNKNDYMDYMVIII